MKIKTDRTKYCQFKIKTENNAERLNLELFAPPLFLHQLFQTVQDVVVIHIMYVVIF